MQENNLKNAEIILERIRSAYKLKNSGKALAEFLGTSEKNVSSWKTRNVIGDWDLIFTKCKGVNFHWLLTGEGEMYTSKPNPDDSKLENQTVTLATNLPREFAELLAEELRNQAWLLTIAELQTQILAELTNTDSSEIWEESKQATGKRLIKLITERK